MKAVVLITALCLAQGRHPTNKVVALHSSCFLVLYTHEPLAGPRYCFSHLQYGEYRGWPMSELEHTKALAQHLTHTRFHLVGSCLSLSFTGHLK